MDSRHLEYLYKSIKCEGNKLDYPQFFYVIANKLACSYKYQKYIVFNKIT